MHALSLHHLVKDTGAHRTIMSMGEDRFPLATGGSGDVPDRRQSFRNGAGADVPRDDAQYVGWYGNSMEVQ